MDRPHSHQAVRENPESDDEYAGIAVAPHHAGNYGKYDGGGGKLKENAGVGSGSIRSVITVSLLRIHSGRDYSDR